MKKFMILLAAVALMTSCSDDDEKITPKDYGMKTFSADMKYQPEEGGMSHDFNCKQQTYFKLGQNNAVAVGEFGTDSWTRFDLLPKLPKEKDKNGAGLPEIDNPNYNVTTTVKGWDLLFTQYVGDAYNGHGPEGNIMPYFLAGVLINTANVQVGLHKYEESEIPEDIAKAFADLKLSDVANVEYSGKIDAIGTSFRALIGMPPTYKLRLNNFYIIKTNNGDIYKLRFIGYYGETQKDKVFTCKYALMK